MQNIMAESDVEEAALEILKRLGYEILYGPDMAPAPDGVKPERDSYVDVVLKDRLRTAISKLNPQIPKDAREEAFKKVLRAESQSLIANNHSFHKMLVEGVEVEYKHPDGGIKGDKVWLFDFEKPENNEFLAVNQFTVIENRNNRRPDIVIFVNGLPLVVIELKNLAEEKATIESAYNQLQTYKEQIPTLFNYNEILVVSDGLQARAGTISSEKQWFLPWKKVSEKLSRPIPNAPQLKIILEGVFSKDRLLDIVRHFVVFERDREKLVKKLAAYHQFFAANKAVQATIKATKSDKRSGVVWHTQGSGKSLTMVFYAGKLVTALDNPTIVVLTDRNDLDEQLFGTFSKCSELLRQTPVQADSRKKLKELLQVPSGGVVFTTIQKFSPEEGEKYPTLSKRSNIIVIADEAHRSQYGFQAKVMKKKDEASIRYGFAKYLRDALPNASFIGFTGTPIEKTDRNTPAVFGKYIDIYDVTQAVEDKATVTIYYESRLAKLELKPEERPKIDTEFEEVTEGEEVARKEKLKSKWARLEKLVGSEKRIKRIAKDIVRHFEERIAASEGKGIIVCMSRRICVELYKEIVKLRPQWHNKDDDKGFLKVVMTGSASDPLDWQEHIRNKQKRQDLGDRMRDPNDSLKLSIVRDMWLTGFDVPSMHTMYIDKPMRGHTLMQAIARVNRVYKDKNGGLIVDYLGMAEDLKNALAEYSPSDRKQAGIPIETAIAAMQEKYEIVNAMFHGFNYKEFFKVSANEKMTIILKGMEHILKEKGLKERFLKQVTLLSQAFALVTPQEEATKIREDLGFFQAVRAGLVKSTSTTESPDERLDTSIKQLISKSIISDRVIDIFAAAGLKKPDISVLSDEFLASVKELPQKNVAFEALKKILEDNIKIRMRKNIVEGRSFAEMLEKSIREYQNRSIEAAEIVNRLIELAKQMNAANKRGEKLNLKEDELAFYDALETNDSAVKVLGDEKLRLIAQDLVKTVRNNVSIDWSIRENVKAKLRISVKRVLKKYGYPPDKQEKATQTVLEQAEVVGKNWVEMEA